jgi:hypothetical protein
MYFELEETIESAETFDWSTVDPRAEIEWLKGLTKKS